MRKICFLIDDYSAVGGIQRVCSIIASALSNYFEVHVLSMYKEYGDQNDHLYNRKIYLKNIINGKKRYLVQSPKVTLCIKKYLIENNIDLIIGTSEMLSPYCLLATRRTRIKYICWTHTPALNNAESKLQYIFKKIGVKYSSNTIVLTEDTKKLLVNKYGVNHITVIPNPIDPMLQISSEYNSKSKKIITVGRISYQKYYEKLIEVADIVLKKDNELIWDIYGGGKNIDYFRKIIEEKGLNNKLNLYDSVNDIYDKYKGYALQVMTSRYEGFPMTILEGMFFGLPIISFDISGPNVLIKNKLGGYLIQPYDENKMADAIIHLMHNQSLRIDMSEFNRKQIKKYEIGNIINEWVKLIEYYIHFEEKKE